MRSTLRALRFLAATTLLPTSEEPGEALELRLPDGWTCEADFYPARGRSAGLILFVHGMSPAGRRDPRMCKASRALAAAGFHVVTPRVPDFEALRIDFETAAHIERCVRAAHARTDWSGGGQIGLFSVSYSAGVSLIASTHAGVAPLLSVICALGTFSNVVIWTRFLMTHPEADEYGRLIVFRNLLHRVIGPRPAVERGLDLALNDHWYKLERPHFPDYLETIEAEDRQILSGVRYEYAEWSRYGTRLLELASGDFDPLDVLARADRLRVPTVLLHGADDRVVPPEESRSLFAEIQRHGGPARLVVTPLLGHGEAAFGLRSLSDALSVIGAFAEFFGRVAAGSTRAT